VSAGRESAASSSGGAPSASGAARIPSAPHAPPDDHQLAFYLQALLENLPDKIYFKDRDSRFMAMSREVATQVGLEPRKLLGKTDFDVFTGEHAEQAFRDEQEIIRTGMALVNFEEKETLPSGAVRWVSSTKMPLRDRAGRIIGTFGLSRDITDRKRMEDQLVRRTFYDGLTGLPNRALFLNRLDQLCQENTRGMSDAGTFAVITLNLDRFQQVNESLGHDAGDEVLVQVSRRLQACLVEDATLARLGADEFAVLLEHVPEPGEVGQLAERLMAAMATPVSLRGMTIYIGASAGLVLSGASHQRGDQVLRDADIALHRAKARGPGERQLFDAEMHRQAVLRMRLETDLRAALDRRELDVFYQPIVDLRQRRVVSFEALVRWHHPEKGLLTPDVFVPVAEVTGLIDKLGEIVLERAVGDLRRLQAKCPPGGPPLRVNVNLSAMELRNARLIEQIADAIKAAEVPPGCLVVELTESAILSDRARARAALDEIRALGVRLHVDDFGTGYSSLGQLHALPADALKIDRTFVTNLGSTGGAMEIVRAIMALAQALRLDVVAEGVETREQLAILTAMGCSAFQGFLFARTMPLEQAEAWLASDPLAGF
jgi:diguanylate cyclase (GGDEF)-like protein/PAS domain S-box-containing protein